MCTTNWMICFLSRPAFAFQLSRLLLMVITASSLEGSVIRFEISVLGDSGHDKRHPPCMD